MNIFSKKLFFVLISFVLFLFFTNSVKAVMIGLCRCGDSSEDVEGECLSELEEQCEDFCVGVVGEREVVGAVCEGGEIEEEGCCVSDADPSPECGAGEVEEDGSCVPAPTEAEKSTVKAIQLESPIEDTDIVPLIGRVIRTALGVVGAIALLMFVYGGLIWLTSGGTPDKIKKGMDVLLWAAIGLVVIFASYTLVDFVFTALGVS